MQIVDRDKNIFPDVDGELSARELIDHEFDNLIAIINSMRQDIIEKVAEKVEYDEDDRDRPMTQRDREISDWVKGRGR